MLWILQPSKRSNNCRYVLSLLKILIKLLLNEMNSVKSKLKYKIMMKSVLWNAALRQFLLKVGGLCKQVLLIQATARSTCRENQMFGQRRHRILRIKKYQGWGSVDCWYLSILHSHRFLEKLKIKQISEKAHCNWCIIFEGWNA